MALGILDFIVITVISLLVGVVGGILGELGFGFFNKLRIKKSQPGAMDSKELKNPGKAEKITKKEVEDKNRNGERKEGNYREYEKLRRKANDSKRRKRDTKRAAANTAGVGKLPKRKVLPNDAHSDAEGTDGADEGRDKLYKPKSV